VPPAARSSLHSPPSRDGSALVGLLLALASEHIALNEVRLLACGVLGSKKTSWRDRIRAAADHDTEKKDDGFDSGAVFLAAAVTEVCERRLMKCKENSVSSSSLHLPSSTTEERNGGGSMHTKRRPSRRLLLGGDIDERQLSETQFETFAEALSAIGVEAVYCSSTETERNNSL
jgi:hypothetical protein